MPYEDYNDRTKPDLSGTGKFVLSLLATLFIFGAYALGKDQGRAENAMQKKDPQEIKVILQQPVQQQPTAPQTITINGVSVDLPCNNPEINTFDDGSIEVNGECINCEN
jgi:hypothetical protein